MEHIRQHDWCSSKPDIHFVTEKDIDNCVIERILRNKFHDPLLSSDNSDTDDESQRVKIDWDEVFKKKDSNFKQKHYIPGMHSLPPCPKLSALTAQQHFQMLKMLSVRNPNVLCVHPVYYNPSRLDLKVFEDFKEIYEKEQKEFKEWAKSLWTSNHCVRALRPKPTIEMVYEAEFKMRANEMAAFPKRYEMAALIPFDNNQKGCEIVFRKTLIKVDISQLPNIEYPDLQKKCTILTPCPVPEPCTKHPVRFILPNEQSMSILPKTEVHRELAQYAYDNGAMYIASENALKCMVETDLHWAIPVSVCEVIGAEGEKVNVFVFGSEFSNNREPAQTRTYKAFRHLVESAFVSTSEKIKILKENEKAADADKKKKEVKTVPTNNITTDDLSSDDEDHLVIADDVCEINVPENIEPEKPKKTKPTETKQKEHIIFEKRVTRSMSKSDDDDEYDDIDESVSNHDPNNATNIDCEIDGFHDTNATESDNETDDIEMHWTKMDNSYINETILNDPKKNCTPFDICEIIGVKWDDREINVTEIDDCGTDGTTSNDNETDETRAHTALTKNYSPKQTEKRSTLFDMSDADYDSDASMALEIVSDSESPKKENNKNMSQTIGKKNAHTPKAQKKESPEIIRDGDSDITVVKIKPDPDALEAGSSKGKDEGVSQLRRQLKTYASKSEKNKIVVEKMITRSKSRDDEYEPKGTIQMEIKPDPETLNAESTKKRQDQKERKPHEQKHQEINVVENRNTRKNKVSDPEIQETETSKEKTDVQTTKTKEKESKHPKNQENKNPKTQESKEGVLPLKNKDDGFDSDSIVQPDLMSDSKTQTDSTSKKDSDEQTSQTIAKKRKAHIPKNQVTYVKKVKPPESQDTEKDKNNDKNESDVNKKNDDRKDCHRRDSFYKCTCEDSAFKKPPPRSFTKYLVKNNATHEKFDLIVHCSHKYRNQTYEVLLEPVPEYQIDLGASYQSPQKLVSMALSLHLRTCSMLLNVRIDSPTGDVVRIDDMRRDLLEAKLIREAASVIHSALSQLQGLLPGHYILQHEPSHGSNALLFAPRVTAAKDKQRLTLDFDCSQMAETDESKTLKTPTLTDILLPAHKFRRILPCAFSPFEHHVAKEPKKPVAKQKPPPQAIKWPKKKGGRKKKKNRNNN
ncbi:uncharacterized protein LOC113235105 isoform X2 [Hyposmocoma kahamanoa]|uniref:uncharacterized protein LOC113235105 isoform X2 n=1 Tax=Hyposmocoma kahamanoa TaxID=1477025 RepID=UPI000E6D860B|nr:uncharacterized protein LOC113235105 isoform X2 [Hyposmocoma kahamanoa]